jgi:hypothetical protein
VDAYKALLPVFQVLGRLQLQILEVDESSPQPDAARNNKTSPDTGSAAP